MDEKNSLSVARNTKIGFFHLGSGMADVLTTGVWNRIMISDLGFSSALVGLLVGLRYFLAPLGIWAGSRSDRWKIFGFRRLPWIWGGRGLMALSTFGLGYGTAELARNLGNPPPAMWGLIIISMIAFSLGNALSGSTFLALIYDRTTDEQRGRAVGIVWTFLLLGFTVAGIFFGILLPEAEGAGELSFTPDDLFMLFVLAAGAFVVLWFFSLLGEESRKAVAELSSEDTPQRSLREDLALVRQNPAMRFFLFYLSMSMFFAFSQDAILEPFAGDVLDMPAAETNRFSMYWGGTAILGTLFFIWLSRKIPRFTNTVMSQAGVVLLIVTFVVLTAMSVLNLGQFIIPGLLLFGLGLGMWNVGTLGLMMDMSPLGRAGTFLGFWSMSVTLSRGSGVASGGIARDVVLAFGGDLPLAYGAVFGAAAIGLVVALWCLAQVHVKEYKKNFGDMDTSTDTAGILAGSMD